MGMPMPISKPRLVLIVVAGLLAASLFLPLWSTEMESPQYHGEEEIKVMVYPGWIRGNLREVETLNQYIGVHLPLDVPELRAAPWVIGGLLALVLISVALPTRFQRVAEIVDLSLMVACTLGGAVLLQYRLYQLGHVRTHAALARVPDFTPPILGEMRLANFEVHTGLMVGGWAFLGAIALTGLAIWMSRPARPASSGFSYSEPLQVAR
jgi:copper chaperone NosL